MRRAVVDVQRADFGERLRRADSRLRKLDFL
jgi:hypothetical protein